MSTSRRPWNGRRRRLNLDVHPLLRPVCLVLLSVPLLLLLPPARRVMEGVFHRMVLTLNRFGGIARFAWLGRFRFPAPSHPHAPFSLGPPSAFSASPLPLTAQAHFRRQTCALSGGLGWDSNYHALKSACSTLACFPSANNGYFCVKEAIGNDSEAPSDGAKQAYSAPAARDSLARGVSSGPAARHINSPSLTSSANSSLESVLVVVVAAVAAQTRRASAPVVGKDILSVKAAPQCL
ncbi:hypothetical protein B0H17DRAFT_1207217 [Mycena rosella]|uniref:Uncharacterized protein n=1 Tax=Mycena rosella TaxID=1033263 RepID=A0AAD7GAR9_MYCRO|nr:hypothetical protein B0H17DRAFT_1207217 [Mycena rosella]